ncbi:MAG: hypothetical protein SF187_14375 [Deltaproteobacteria bacterium]|nr:hypothetical protein [Deltaproteobacteria bacterium]
MATCGKPARPAAVWMALLLMCACGDESAGGSVPTNLVLTAEPAALGLAPGQVGEVNFRLADKAGRARASNTVRFALVDAPASEGGVAGASLFAPEGITDAQGIVVARVRAGAAGSFRVRASWSGAGDLFVPVVVATRSVAPASAIVVPAADTKPASVEMRLYEGAACGALNVTTPAPSEPANSRTLAVAAAWQLPSLATDRSYALTARAIDQTGGVISFGCVQIHGNQLLQSTPVTFSIPLAAIPVTLAATYEASSEFIFAPESMPQAQAVGAAWGQLSRCPHDPAQRWLDCTLDALGPTTAGSKLDCIPEADEGPVGQLLLAKRGTLMEAADGCRDAKNAAGQMSADAQVLKLFPSPATGARAALPAIAKAAAGLFSQIRFASSIELAPSGEAGTWVGTHTARSLGFSVGLSFYSVPLSSRPGRFSRFVQAKVDDAQKALTFLKHGFGMRLGSAAHAAFRNRVLTYQGFAADERVFLNDLFSQAAAPGAPNVKGCDALDALLCPQLGKPGGCLQTACTAGLETMATQLTAGFDALDGDDIDFVLDGSASILDRTVDGTVKGLGSLVPSRGDPGLWTAQVRSPAGNTELSGIWVAARPLAQ